MTTYVYTFYALLNIFAHCRQYYHYSYLTGCKGNVTKNGLLFGYSLSPRESVSQLCSLIGLYPIKYLDDQYRMKMEHTYY